LLRVVVIVEYVGDNSIGIVTVVVVVPLGIVVVVIAYVTP
jgi:hypothetical protein